MSYCERCGAKRGLTDIVCVGGPTILEIKQRLEKLEEDRSLLSHIDHKHQYAASISDIEQLKQRLEKLEHDIRGGGFLEKLEKLEEWMDLVNSISLLRKKL